MSEEQIIPKSFVKQLQQQQQQQQQLQQQQIQQLEHKKHLYAEKTKAQEEGTTPSQKS
jgi:hypothetical protein